MTADLSAWHVSLGSLFGCMPTIFIGNHSKSISILWNVGIVRLFSHFGGYDNPDFWLVKIWHAGYWTVILSCYVRVQGFYNLRGNGGINRYIRTRERYFDQSAPRKHHRHIIKIFGIYWPENCELDRHEADVDIIILYNYINIYFHRSYICNCFIIDPEIEEIQEGNGVYFNFDNGMTSQSGILTVGSMWWFINLILHIDQ